LHVSFLAGVLVVVVKGSPRTLVLQLLSNRDFVLLLLLQELVQLESSSNLIVESCEFLLLRGIQATPLLNPTDFQLLFLKPIHNYLLIPSFLVHLSHRALLIRVHTPVASSACLIGFEGALGVVISVRTVGSFGVASSVGSSWRSFSGVKGLKLHDLFFHCYLPRLIFRLVLASNLRQALLVEGSPQLVGHHSAI